MSKYRKIVAAVAGLVVAIGILDEGTAQDVAAAVTALLVYFVPNAD